MQNKIVAIDYDDTISLNIDAWQQIINLFHSLGALVFIVTYRESINYSDMHPMDNVQDVVFTNATAKKHYCKEIAGIDVDIWIDDSPESIIFNYNELLDNLPIK